MGLNPVAAEALLCAWLFTVGAAGVLFVRGSVGSVGVLVLGYPLGVAATVVTASLAMLAGLPAPHITAAAVLTVAALAALVATARVLRPGDWAAVAGGPVAAAGLSVTFQAANLTRLTPDSFRYIEIGALVERTGDLADAPDWLLQQRPLFVPLMFGPSGWLDQLYLPSLLPLLAVAAGATVVWLGYLCLGELAVPTVLRVLLPLLGLAVLLSSDRFVYHAFYVNGHLAFGLYYLLLTGSAWLAATRPDPRWAWPASAAAVAVTLLRPEAPLMLALALTPVVVAESLPRRTRWLIAGPALASTLLYTLAVLLPRSGDETFDPLAHGSLVIALGLLALLAAGHVRPLRPLTRHAPTLLVLALAAPVAMVPFVAPEAWDRTLWPMWDNIAGHGLWRATFLVLPVVVAALAVATRLPSASFWLTPLVGFVPMLLLLGVVRGGGYRAGTGDSGNRMLMQILLVAVTYAVVAIGSAFRSRAADRHTAGYASGTSSGHR
jgi:hypothetical protein